jgi:hypothetical protein
MVAVAVSGLPSAATVMRVAPIPSPRTGHGAVHSAGSPAAAEHPASAPHACTAAAYGAAASSPRHTAPDRAGGAGRPAAQHRSVALVSRCVSVTRKCVAAAAAAVAGGGAAAAETRTTA